MIGETWKETAINMAVMAAVSMVVLLGYHAWRTFASPRFAIVDISSIVRTKEEGNAALLQKPGLPDAEKRKIIGSMGAFALSLDEAVRQTASDCHCVILSHAAVLSGEVEDLTPDVRRRLGM